MTDLVALKAEFDNDPASVGYAALIAAADWRGLSGVTNLVRLGSSVTESTLSPVRMRAAVVHTDYIALTDTQRVGLNFYLQGESPVDVSVGTGIRTALLALLGATATATAWGAMLDRDGSRAEVALGPGVIATYQDCRDAARLP